MKTFPSLLMFCILAAACDPLPTTVSNPGYKLPDLTQEPGLPQQPEPSQPTQPPIPWLPTEDWALITTLDAANAADACSWHPALGLSQSWNLRVQRSSAAAVRFVYGQVPDETTYEGTLSNDQFSATSPVFHGAMGCNGGRVDGSFWSAVNGSFATDGRTLSGTEVWTFRRIGSEDISISFKWSAVPR